jgi:hypothetical protein
MDMEKPMLVTTQGRGRVTLGALAKASQYMVHEEPGGIIVLEPAVVMSLTEKKLLEDAAFMAVIRDSREHPEKMVKRDRSNSPRA